MGKSFKRLKGVLQLEAQQKYKDKAVVGGIRKFTSYWVDSAREEAIDEADRAFVEQTAELLNEYHSLNSRMRENAVERILDKLNDREKRVRQLEAAQPTPAAPAPAPSPAAPEPVAEKIEQPLEKQEPVTAAAPPPEKEPTPIKLEAPVEDQKPDPTLEEPTSDPRPKRERDQDSGSPLERPVITLRGVGPQIAELLNKLGLHTIDDLLHHYPRRYDDYTTMKPINRLEYGESVTIIGTIWQVNVRKSRNNATVTQAIISDGSGKIQASWFNQPWLKQKLKTGLRIVMSGKVDQYLGRKVFNSPQWELLSMDALKSGQMVPIYPLTGGLTNHKLGQIMKSAVPYFARKVDEYMPETVLKAHGFPDLTSSLLQIHLPRNQNDVVQARRRLIFDEMFLLQLGMLGQKRDWVQTPGRALQSNGNLFQLFVDNLPFTMTGAQQRVVSEITADLETPQPMNRLLQGDVGAGKTIVAAAGMVHAVAAGAQAAMMAPTEILAEQHARGLSKLLEPLGISLVLLTGSLSASEKAAVKEQIRSGEAQIIVGTHALIQDDVEFKDLGLAVIDEQHRFGVDQRKALRDKGPAGKDGEGHLSPHLLVMSATPIPRSLALSLYGDLDLSILDEMPPGRQEIKTHWIRPRERERCYAFLKGQIEQGRQAYIIYPLVEESEKVDADAAVEGYQRLANEIFPKLRIGLVHGKLKADEKEAVMRRFYDGELDILVATSVIEVGVDVPNSTVMMIEGANRFGLAQLHQFRGRVGRGEHQSYCLLVADETTPEAEERLTALEQTNDGFQLAEKDLELRGPGQFFGRQQSGMPELQLASLSDTNLLEEARDSAKVIFDADPNLERPEHQGLHARVIHFWEHAADIS